MIGDSAVLYNERKCGINDFKHTVSGVYDIACFSECIGTVFEGDVPCFVLLGCPLHRNSLTEIGRACDGEFSAFDFVLACQVKLIDDEIDGT